MKLSSVRREMGRLYSFSEPLVLTDHILYTNKDGFASFTDKRILLVCGGGSSKWITHKLCASYDHIWSMNYFFRHLILSNYLVSLCMMSTEVFENAREEFEQYLKDMKNKTFVGIESSEALNTLSKQVNSFYQPARMFCMHTSLYNQLGYGVRMVILAAELGVQQIDFIGMDGAKAILNRSHAFEKGKKVLPRGGGVQPENAIEVFQKQYDFTWSYILQNFPKIKIRDLNGKINPMHRVLYESY